MSWQDGFAEKAGQHAKAVGGRAFSSIASDEVEAFAALYNTTTRPKALDAVVRDFHLSRDGKREFEKRIVDRTDRNGKLTGPLNRHQAEFASLCRVARGAMARKFAYNDGKERIEAASVEECDKRGEIFDSVDFAKSARDAAQRALAQGQESVEEQEFRPPNPSFNGHSSTYDPWEWVETTDEIGNRILEMLDWMASDEADSHKPKAEKSESIFREYGPTEWAKPVEPTSFFIKQALCTDTWGVNGGPEKSLKTHDNFAIGMSIATGINLYRSDLLPVLRQGKALLIVGEGGEKQILRLLHRMCRAYGIKVEDVLNDPLFPLVVEFGAASLNSDPLRDEIKEKLDRIQPHYVSMESFYNFHPVEVSAANLYERGQVIDSYHKLVREGGSDVVSMLTDHNKKGANELGLRHISMSGQAENSDSWIQRIHRRDPEVASGEFGLTTSFNSRNWGGSTFDVDWHLGPFDHDAGCHTGNISWDVCPNKAAAGGGTDSGVKLDVGILVRDNPWKFNRQQIFEKLRPVRKQDVYTAIKEMVDEGELNEESPKLHGHGGKAVVIGPGPGLAALIGKVVAHGGGRTP